jgi:hypothetical protein
MEDKVYDIVLIDVLPIQNKSTYCVSTGYFFEIHTNKKMEILYDFENERIICQLSAQWKEFDSLLGFVLKIVENNYYQILVNYDLKEVLSYGEVSDDDELEFRNMSFDNAKNYRESTITFSLKNLKDNTLKTIPIYFDENERIFWTNKGERKFSVVIESFEKIDLKIKELNEQISKETNVISKLRLNGEIKKLIDSKGGILPFSDYNEEEDNNIYDSEGNNFWACSACGGDNESGCLMSDPQNCSR